MPSTEEMWVLLYRDGSTRRYVTLGPCSEISKSQAKKKRDEILAEVNARNSAVPDADITFGGFVEAVALPFCRSKWKQSTAATTENRIRHHLIVEFGEALLRDLRLNDLQSFLNGKSAAGLSTSVVAHLRWDLHLMFKVARAEGYIERDPTQALFTPRATEAPVRRTMTIQEVAQHIAALDQQELRHRSPCDLCRDAARGDSWTPAPAREQGRYTDHHQAARIPGPDRYAEDELFQ